jgi:hypothetical protein
MQTHLDRAGVNTRRQILKALRAELGQQALDRVLADPLLLGMVNALAQMTADNAEVRRWPYQ